MIDPPGLKLIELYFTRNYFGCLCEIKYSTTSQIHHESVTVTGKFM